MSKHYRQFAGQTAGTDLKQVPRRKDLQVLDPVTIHEKYILPIIAALGNVVWQSRQYYAG
jgi:hypothetical protein